MDNKVEMMLDYKLKEAMENVAGYYTKEELNTKKNKLLNLWDKLDDTHLEFISKCDIVTIADMLESGKIIKMCYTEKFNEMIQGIQKLQERGYICKYELLNDQGINYIKIHIGNLCSFSPKKGNKRKTVNKLRNECKKRGLYYEDHTTSNRNLFFIYEKNPLDVF